MIICEENTFTRTNPFIGKIKERSLLNAPGSSKRTYHIVLDIKGSKLNCKPGDAIAILPENPEDEVVEILERLGARGDELVTPKRQTIAIPFREYLKKEANLAQLPKAIDPSGSDLPLLDFLRLTGAKPSPSEIAAHLGPMLPRFYSLASSSKVHPHEVHLAVATFSKKVGDRDIPGLGSDYLAAQAAIESTPIRLYLQSNPRFTLPENPTTPIIMIGPGTGIAPFRAFLQERILERASRNWLFFGERHGATDFYYRDELLGWQSQGQLKLSTAFSRESDAKVYVQHRILEQRDEFISWVQAGAIIYICGDAKKMAKEVTQTLDEILTPIGLSAKSLRQEKRLLLDVY